MFVADAVHDRKISDNVQALQVRLECRDSLTVQIIEHVMSQENEREWVQKLEIQLDEMHEMFKMMQDQKVSTAVPTQCSFKIPRR